MTKTHAVMVAIYLTVFGFLYFTGNIASVLHSFYIDNKLQMPLFSGLLTVGAFLLSMKTFIIFKLKECLYDNLDYIKNCKKSLVGDTSKYDHYIGLKQLSDYLSIGIFGSLVSSFLNIGIGFTGSKITSVICISFSFVTISILIFAWYLVSKNLRDWLDLLNNPFNPSDTTETGES